MSNRVVNLRRVDRLLLLGVAALLLALSPSPALAAEPRGGSTVVVGPGETINDDLYISGGTSTIQGTVNGDVVAAGGTITITGNVTGDVTAAGGSIDVSGPVGGSVRAAGGNLLVNGPIQEDVVVFGGNLTTGGNGTIGRDLLLGAGTAVVNGRVDRNISGGVGNLTLAAPVGGNVAIDVGTLELASGASIAGSLRYTSDREASIAQGATVQGGVQRVQPAQQQPVGPANPIIDWLRNLVGLFLLGLLFVLLLPAFSRLSAFTLARSPWASLGLGVATIIVLPVLALLLFVLGLFIGGWWIGLIALAILGVALALSFVVAGLFAGRWLLDRAGMTGVHNVWATLLGLAVLLLLATVPFIGGIVMLAAMLFGLGALALAAARSREEPPAPVARQEIPPSEALAA